MDKDLMLLTNNEMPQDGASAPDDRITIIRDDADDVITNIPLPADKRYHVMFSHESGDRDWVIRYMVKLEQEPYNLKCCFSDRDFLPSRTVIENIGEAMSQSMSVVHVITPEHQTSPYCEDEVGLAFQMKRENQLVIIPVLLRGPDEQVPVTLRFINYIDARSGTNEDDVINKILRALQNGGLGLQERRGTGVGVNGDIIKIPSVTYPHKLPRAGKHFPNATNDDVRLCEEFGIKIPLSSLNDVNRLMSDCPLMRSCRLLIGCPGLVLLMILNVLTVTSTLLVMTLPIYMAKGSEVWLMIIISVATTAVIVVLDSLFLVQLFKRYQRQALEYAGHISQHLLLRYKILVAIVIENKVPKLQIIKYDHGPCEEYLFDMLTTSSDSVADTKRIKKDVRVLIQRAIPKYLPVLVKCAKSNIGPRHRMKKDVMCLCQYIERHDIQSTENGDVMAIDNIEVISENATRADDVRVQRRAIPLIPDDDDGAGNYRVEDNLIQILVCCINFI